MQVVATLQWFWGFLIESDPLLPRCTVPPYSVESAISCQRLGFTGTVRNILFLAKHYGLDVTSPGDAFHHIATNMTDPQVYMAYMGCSINYTIGDIILASLLLFYIYYLRCARAVVVVQWHQEDETLAVTAPVDDDDE